MGGGRRDGFPLKSGGFAAEQADVVAHSVAAAAGAPVEPIAFAPPRSEDLVGLPAGRFLGGWLTAGDDAVRSHLPTASGVPVLTYLQRDLAEGWRPYG